MTNETAPARIWATYNDAFGINWQDGQFTTSEQPACGRYTPYIREDISEIRTERVIAELEAAQARIAELEGAVNKELSDRMVAAGMVPLDAITKPNCLTKYEVHAGMTDLPFFMEWLERKTMEYSRMQAAHQTRSYVLDEDIFDFVFGRAAAFKEVLNNYRAALEGKG